MTRKNKKLTKPVNQYPPKDNQNPQKKLKSLKEIFNSIIQEYSEKTSEFYNIHKF